MGDCAENIALFAEHKETYDALLAEARALREEEIRMAQAFSELPPALATAENFQLFMRDIHHAHEELRKRLDALSDEHVGQKLEDVKTRWQGVRERLESVLHDTCEEWMPPRDTLGFLACANEYVKKDIERVEQRLQNLCDNLPALQDACVQDLRNHNTLISHESAAIRASNNFGIIGAKWPWNTTSVQLLHSANGRLSTLDNHQRALSAKIEEMNGKFSQLVKELCEIKSDLRFPVEKYEPVRSRVGESSPLAKLIDYLNDNC